MTETTYVPTNIRLAHRGYEASAVIDRTDGYLQGMLILVLQSPLVAHRELGICILRT